MPLDVYIGHDSRMPEVSAVCAYSLKRHATTDVRVHVLDQARLRAGGLFTRAEDPKASTEFTYTRFLTPSLNGFQGQALFCDNDFLWLGDVARLLDEAEDGKALNCVQHDYTPKATTKMDGQEQSAYPRKNWSSLMLFDAGHPSNAALTPEVVSSQTPQYLHRMQWLDDSELGELHERWNWLEGWHSGEPEEMPGAIHYTMGGPWFDECRGVDFADLWLEERDRWERDGRPSAEG